MKIILAIYLIVVAILIIEAIFFTKEIEE